MSMWGMWVCGYVRTFIKPSQAGDEGTGRDHFTDAGVLILCVRFHACACGCVHAFIYAGVRH